MYNSIDGRIGFQQTKDEKLFTKAFSGGTDKRIWYFT
jgi:hypothetical protein